MAPVLLGDGVPLRGRGGQVPMTLSAVEQFAGVLRLRYVLDGVAGDR